MVAFIPEGHLCLAPDSQAFMTTSWNSHFDEEVDA